MIEFIDLVLKGRRGAAKRWQQRLEIWRMYSMVQRHSFAEHRGCPKIAMFMQTTTDPHTQKDIYIYYMYTLYTPQLIGSTYCSLLFGQHET